MAAKIYIHIKIQVTSTHTICCCNCNSRFFFFQADLRIPRNQKKGGGKKASSFRETGGTYLLCTLSNLRESSGQVFGSTPLLSKYCPVVPEVKTGKPTYIHWAACFPHCCGALAKRTLLAGSSTQTKCVEYYYIISRRYHRRSRRNVAQMHGTIREDRTGPVNPAWTGHRMVCNL